MSRSRFSCRNLRWYLYRVGLVFLLLCACSPFARAEPSSPPSEPGADQDQDASKPKTEARSVVVRLKDLEDVLGGVPPTIILEHGEYRLEVVPPDDGSPPDIKADDGTYTIGVPDVSGLSFEVTVKSGGDKAEVLGRGNVDFSEDSTERDIAIALATDGVRIGISDDSVLSPKLSGEGGGVGADGVGLWPGWFVLAALLAGAAVARVQLKRPRRSGMQLAGQGMAFSPLGPSLPGMADGCSLWWVSEDKRVSVCGELSIRLSGRGPVLLVPAEDSRPTFKKLLRPLVADVWMMEQERPSALKVIRAARKLSLDGRSATIVIEGASALEPANRRKKAAALDEMLRAREFVVFVVESDRQTTLTSPCKRVEVREDGDGGLSANGVRIELGEERDGSPSANGVRIELGEERDRSPSANGVRRELGESEHVELGTRGG